MTFAFLTGTITSSLARSLAAFSIRSASGIDFFQNIDDSICPNPVSLATCASKSLLVSNSISELISFSLTSPSTPDGALLVASGVIATSTRWFFTRIFIRDSYLLGSRRVTPAVPRTTVRKMNSTIPRRRNRALAPSRRLIELPPKPVVSSPFIN